MKQVFAKKGKVEVEEVTPPTCGDKEVKIKVNYSVISVGTELDTIRKVKQPLYKTALEKRDLVEKVFQKARKEGYLKTYKYAKTMINHWWPLGYSCAGEVVEVGGRVNEFSVGDKVACAGQDYASHAEIVTVPKNLVVKVLPGVDLKEAAHTTIGAIAIQGVRRLKVTFGETIVVFGLGLIGQLIVQILKAAGCQVIGIDIDQRRAELAKANVFFTSNIVASVLDYTKKVGADGVIIAAAANSDVIINNAMEMCRQKGRVVLVGKVPMNIKREAMYRKELDFFISTSYGPGRYDPDYEEKGHDYPLGYVRWTENRNMQEFVRLLSEKKISLSKMIEKEFPIEKAVEAYDLLADSAEKPLSVILTYPKNKEEGVVEEIKKIRTSPETVKGKINVALIGVGNFAKGTHLPNLQKIAAFNLRTVVTKTPGSAKNIAQSKGAQFCTTDYREALNDPDVHMVIISTRHDSHAKIAAEALQRGKHVLVEKPMGLNLEQCQEVVSALEANDNLVYSVGFNRNYAPLTGRVKQFLQSRDYPLIINYRVNTKPTGKEDWVNDPEVGGGRIVGEMCHMFSFFNYLVQSDVVSVCAKKINSGGRVMDHNNVVTTIKYKDGSVANLVYTDYANDSVAKERVEIFGGGHALILEDFERLQINGGMTKMKQDKGHFQELVELQKKLQGKKSELTDGDHAFAVMKICFEIMKKVNQK